VTERARPLVSIIVPNFNNGRANARGGRDLLGLLFASLERTLADEPTPWELVVADDGSTDDSLATARAWAERRRPDGTPFLRLVELEHRGVLSRVLNVLEREARGDFLFRLDGDVILATDRWLSAILDVFALDPAIGVVGGVQLRPDGAVHAFGDELWSPRGYRHVGCGVAKDMLPDLREVDTMMGCFYATRRAVHDQVGPYDETVLRGQTEDYSVRVRLAGWRIVATNRVSFEHWHVERAPRANRADRPESLDRALDRFRAKWGFDRLAPDLEEVRARYGGTPLWWRDHAARAARPALDAWERLTADERARRTLAESFDLVGGALQAASAPVPAVLVGSGCGVLAATLARAGAVVEAFEMDENAHAIATARCARAAGPDGRLRLVRVDELARLPLADASRPVVVLDGVLERHWNPAGLLRECRRIVAPKGVVLLRTEPRDEHVLDDPDDPFHRFTAGELLALVQHVGGLATFGFEPRRTASGTLECCFAPSGATIGRGYFRANWSSEVEEPTAAAP
jgi:glycosyltransferase involved in cell wall biosynthesis/SAM-dependent methyltransferase